MSLRHFLLVLSSVLLGPAAAYSNPLAHIQVTARLYDTAAVAVSAKRSALEVVDRTLAPVLIDVAWARCDSPATGDSGRGRPDTCEKLPHSGELVVRLVRSPRPTQKIDRLVMGDAFVAVGTGGVLATIYVDRVERLALAAGTDVATLLGRAIAHELGHLLLATNSHSPRGLMRATWSRDDLRREHQADWTFTREDASAMRRPR